MLKKSVLVVGMMVLFSLLAGILLMSRAEQKVVNGENSDEEKETEKNDVEKETEKDDVEKETEKDDVEKEAEKTDVEKETEKNDVERDAGKSEYTLIVEANRRNWLANRKCVDYENSFESKFLKKPILHEKVVVLAYSRGINNYWPYLNQPSYFPHKCESGVECIWTGDRSHLGTANGVTFGNGLEMFEVATKPDHQKWIFMLMEHESAIIKDFKGWKNNRIDWAMTTTQEHEIPVTYANPIAPENFLTTRKEKNKLGEGKASIAAFISNCGGMESASLRSNKLAELMAEMPVDSYGACHHNKDEPPRGNTSPGGSKIGLLSQYPFYLAWENSNVTGFVTEKFYQGFIAGSVPVHMGAPDAECFVPGPHSFINCDDFGSVKELADYLKFLLENEDEYMKYMEWKKNGVSDRFKILLAKSGHSMEGACRVCDMLARVE